MLDRWRTELVREYTFAFLVQVIARMIGLPRSDYRRFQRLSIVLLNKRLDQYALAEVGDESG